MWWLYFTAAALVLLYLWAALTVLHEAYSKALDSYRNAKFTRDLWLSLSTQLERVICIAAESRAAEAAARLDLSIYRELGILFQSAMEKVREKAGELEYHWEFDGDVFFWEVSLGQQRVWGRVDWLQPGRLAEAAARVDGLAIHLERVEEEFREVLPEGVSLWGVIWGRLYGDGTYSGYLHGEYTLVDNTPLRCVSGWLYTRLYTTHYATYVTNDTAPWIDVWLTIST